MEHRGAITTRPAHDRRTGGASQIGQAMRCPGRNPCSIVRRRRPERMKAALLTAGLVLGLLEIAAPARAETVVIDDQVQLRDSGAEKPSRGSCMKAVEAR